MPFRKKFYLWDQSKSLRQVVGVKTFINRDLERRNYEYRKYSMDFELSSSTCPDLTSLHHLLVVMPRSSTTFFFHEVQSESVLVPLAATAAQLRSAAILSADNTVYLL
ncbi:hypothetical protein J6590_031361 [Homalodisca vitripennis]|nr:hypothetical protein J6590_031361 [Homalodisca vitripennis]